MVDPTVLEHAKKILTEIEKKIKKLERSRKQQAHVGIASAMEELVELSNKYYDLIPPNDVSHSALRPLQQLYNVENERKKLTTLYDLQIATKLMLGARLRKYEVNPYDYLLHNLNVKLRPLEVDSKDYETLLLYANNGLSRQTHNCSVMNIFEIQHDPKRPPTSEM